jgi:ABC-type multidrug transport system fused ATPase/permease subunit
MQTIDLTVKAFGLLDAGMRWRWLTLIPLALLAAGLESLGALLVFALLRLLTDSSSIAGMRIVGGVRSALSDLNDTQFTSLFALFVCLFFLVKNAIQFLEAYLRQTWVGTSGATMSSQLLQRYLSAPYTFHLRHNSADLIRNTHATVDSVCRDFMNSAVAAASEFLVVIGIAVVLLFTAPFATLAGSVVLALIAVASLRLMQRRYSQWGGTVHELDGTIQRSLQEAFRGIKEIKVLGREQYFAQLFMRPALGLARLHALSGAFRVLPRLIVETVFVIGVAGATIIVLREGQSANAVFPVLGLLAYALMRLLPSIHLIVYHLNNCRFRGVAVNQIHRDWVALAPAASDDSRARARRAAFERDIVFEAVSFAYPGAERPALKDIDLTIRRGESIGIVGVTGAGKSTLVDLLMTLLPPSSGRILVDGKDVGEDPAGWRAQIGYVPQQFYLTDDTLRRNVALGMAESEIDDARIEAVLGMAQLADVVAGLPAGVETVLGESGSNLSGGERQRVAIARALYRDPDILIFDEATSALDHRSARAVSRAIETQRGEKTIVIIAHSVLGIRECDRLVMLHDGEIVDVGTGTELAARNAGFREIFGLPAGADAGMSE